MKLKVIIDSVEGLEELASCKLPMRTAYNIKKLMQSIEKETTIFDTLRKNLINEYGERSKEDPNSFTIPQDKVEKFNSEISELLDQEVSIEFNKISLDDIKNIEIAPKYLYFLDWLIEENQEVNI